MHTYITEIAGHAEDDELSAKVKRAFSRAFCGHGELDAGILTMEGLSGRKYRLFINNLMTTLYRPRYLEIGCWTGSTLFSATSGAGVSATTIDDWSEVGAPREAFLANLRRLRAESSDITLIESDFRKVGYASLGPIDVFTYDGPHQESDQYDGIVMPAAALKDEHVLVVDDWNWPGPRSGTLRALGDLRYSIRYALAIRTTLDDSHPELYGEATDWHNGYFIAVLAKPTGHEDNIGLTARDVEAVLSSAAV